MSRHARRLAHAIEQYTARGEWSRVAELCDTLRAVALREPALQVVTRPVPIVTREPERVAYPTPRADWHDCADAVKR